MVAPILTSPSNIQQYAHMLGAQLLKHAPTAGATIGTMAGVILAMTSTAGLGLTLTAALTIAAPTLAGAAVGYVARLLLGSSIERLKTCVNQFLTEQKNLGRLDADVQIDQIKLHSTARNQIEILLTPPKNQRVFSHFALIIPLHFTLGSVGLAYFSEKIKLQKGFSHNIEMKKETSQKVLNQNCGLKCWLTYMGQNIPEKEREAILSELKKSAN